MKKIITALIYVSWLFALFFIGHYASIFMVKAFNLNGNGTVSIVAFSILLVALWAFGFFATQIILKGARKLAEKLEDLYLLRKK